MLMTMSACASVEPPPCPLPTKDVVYVLEQGWHLEIGIPAEELGGDMGFYRAVFPGAKIVLFGYGKKTFFIAPAHSLTEYILGPVPGPAAIQAFAMNVLPMEAYPENEALVFPLEPANRQALLDFIWNDVKKDEAGRPYIIAPSIDPDGLFYDAESTYTLLHTCNTWVVEALQAAGVNVSADGVIFSGQAMGRLKNATAKQCR